MIKDIAASTSALDSKYPLIHKQFLHSVIELFLCIFFYGKELAVDRFITFSSGKILYVFFISETQVYRYTTPTILFLEMNISHIKITFQPIGTIMLRKIHLEFFSFSEYFIHHVYFLSHYKTS